MTVKDDYWGGNWKYLMQYTLAFARWNQCAVKIFIWQMILWFDRIIEQFSSVLVLLMLIFRCVMTKSRIYVKIVTVIVKDFVPHYIYMTVVTLQPWLLWNYVLLCTIMWIIHLWKLYHTGSLLRVLNYFLHNKYEIVEVFLQDVKLSTCVESSPPPKIKQNLPSQTKPLPAKRSVDLVDIILNFSIHASDACKELLKVVSQ